MRPLSYVELDHRKLSSALKESGSVSVLLDRRRAEALRRLIGVTSELHKKTEPQAEVRRLAGASVWSILTTLVLHSRLMQVFGFYETDKPSLTMEEINDNQHLFTFHAEWLASMLHEPGRAVGIHLMRAKVCQWRHWSLSYGAQIAPTK
jgi:hypothetical protein